VLEIRKIYREARGVALILESAEMDSGKIKYFREAKTLEGLPRDSQTDEQ
jgi:hypothetical protein